jgi:hypothetical protein
MPLSIIQILILVFAVFAITRTILQFRRGTFQLLGFCFWLVFWCGVVVVAALPQTADMVAQIVGVGRGADVVTFASLLALFYCIFRLYVKIEQVEGQMTRLVRKMALDDEEKKT